MECGEEGIVYQGLCQKCLPKKRRLLEIPAVLDLAQCPNCGAYKLPGGWRKASLEEALESIASKSAKLPRDVRQHHLTVTSSPEDDRKLNVHVSAGLDLEGMAVTEERELKARVKVEVCPQCSKLKGDYYEAIIQVRAQDRQLREEEMERARRFIAERVSSGEGLFVTREEKVHGGLDVYLSSSRAGKTIAQALGTSLGGRVSSSPRLHTRKKGKDVYRMTYLVRLPGVGEGEVVEHHGTLYQILSMGEPVTLIDLAKGESRKLSRQELLEAQRVEARSVPGVLISASGGEAEVMDSEEYRVRRVVLPSGLELTGNDVTLVITKKGTFVVPPRSAEKGP